MQPMGENFFEKRFTITKVYLRLSDIKPFWKTSYFILARGKPLLCWNCPNMIPGQKRMGWIKFFSIRMEKNGVITITVQTNQPWDDNILSPNFTI